MTDRISSWQEKTISSFKRNVLQNLKLMLTSRGYHWIYHISGDFPNMLEVSRNGRTNYFYIFGGKDEGSQTWCKVSRQQVPF